MQVGTEEEATPNENLIHVDEIGDREISNETHDGPISTTDLMIDPSVKTSGFGLLDEPSNDPIGFASVEQKPEFPGGDKELVKFLSKNLHFPNSAQQRGISGVVYVNFVINSIGEVTNIQLSKGIDDECDKEALRVTGKMPNWKPGRQNGRAVSVRYSLPLRFSITQY